MDLVGIMHVVTHHQQVSVILTILCSWFDIVHSDPLGISFCVIHIDFHPFHSSNVHPMSLVGWFILWFWLVVSRALALVFVWWIFPQNQGSMFMFCQL